MENMIKLINDELYPFSEDHIQLIFTLADARNIAAEYLDFRGKPVQVPFKNIVGILDSMGYSVYEHSSLQCEIDELLNSRWLNLLEPVTVLNPMRPCVVYLYVDAETGDLDGRWKFLSECGDDNLEGCFDLSKLLPSDEYWIKEKNYYRFDIPMPENLPLGYHRLNIQLGKREADSYLIVTPATSFQPPVLQSGKKVWGTSIQLYTLRSSRNWGIGDFTDLNQLIEDMAKHGGDIIGLNPLHYLFPTMPDHICPYSPNSRSYINPIYIDVEKTCEFNHKHFPKAELLTQDFQDILDALRNLDDIEYSAVMYLKEMAFSMLFRCFCDNTLGSGDERDRAYNDFVVKKGKSLQDFAVHESMFSFFNTDWTSWPEEYQDPCSEAVKQFSETHKDSVGYHIYLQFLAEEQMGEACKLSQALGMRIGICNDLPVGATPYGFDTWANKAGWCSKVSIGAPPDELSLTGQAWGSFPLDPIYLKESGYQSVIKLFRDNMQVGGALRIDHAMFLSRLWWCPFSERYGYDAKDGAYVYYDLLDMIGILNLESQRNSCMVIAEDIGTVPSEVREAFSKSELYGSKVLLLEPYAALEKYPLKTAAMICNHDLPTLKAYWEMNDLDLRFKLNQFPSEADYLNCREVRQSNKIAILEGLKQSSINCSEISDVADMDMCFMFYKYLATSNAQLITVQLEDLMLMTKPVNIPGVDYPSWRRKLAQSTGQLFSRPEIAQLCAQLNSLRNFSVSAQEFSKSNSQRVTDINYEVSMK